MGKMGTTLKVHESKLFHLRVPPLQKGFTFQGKNIGYLPGENAIQNMKVYPYTLCHEDCQ